jgi:hypothetical protein
MTCPNCRCKKCRAAAVNAVLSRHIASRETESPRQLDESCDTFGGPRPRRFLEPRELGKPPIDPDAEQLAGQVGELARELERGVG